jgi:hypothetical protein
VRRFLLCFVIFAFALASSASANIGRFTPKPGPPPTVKSCLNTYPLTVQFSAEKLASLGRYGAKPANNFTVTLTLQSSHVTGNSVACFYKSASGDIGNLVYSFTCRHPQPANNGDVNAYKCS